MAGLGGHLDPYFSNPPYHQNMQSQTLNDPSNPSVAKRHFENRPNFNLPRLDPSQAGYDMPQLDTFQSSYPGFALQDGFSFSETQGPNNPYSDVYGDQYDISFTSSPFMQQTTPYSPAMQPTFSMDSLPGFLGPSNPVAPPLPMYNHMMGQAVNEMPQNSFSRGPMRQAPRQQQLPNQSYFQNKLKAPKVSHHPAHQADHAYPSLDSHALKSKQPVSSATDVPSATYPSRLSITSTHNFQYPEIDPTTYDQHNLMRELLEGDGMKARALMVSKDTMPFEDAAGSWGPAKFGVAKIGNIPYAVTKQEIVHFIGRSAKMISPERGCPIHIIMERSTSKTMDCFVEFITQEEAATAVRKYWHYVESGKHPRLGTRHVDMELSNQDELLKGLFPRAKCVKWTDGVPKVIANKDPYSTGFQGFFTSEEMVGLVRHAEHPQRSPFSTKCLQRTYECMISTLYKFPWHATELYSIKDRNLLFKTYMSQLYVLVRKVECENIVGLDHKLFRDFLLAGLNCPAFTERFKYEIIVASGRGGASIHVSNLTCFWPFDTVARKPMQNDNFIEFYMNLVERGVAVTQLGTATLTFFDTSQPESYLPRGMFSNMQYSFNEKSSTYSWKEAYTIESTLMLDLVTNGIDHLLKERTLKEPACSLSEPVCNTPSRKSSGDASQRSDDNPVTPSSIRSLSALHSSKAAIAAQNKPIFDPAGMCGFPLDLKPGVETIHEEDEE